MDKQHRAFISYSRANKDFTLRLARELKAKGFPVWLDQLDIPLGERWDRQVERALKECEIVIFIMTPNSINSENVMDEIGYALDHHKHFMPIFLENCEIPFRLRRFQYLDFTNQSFEDGVAAAGEFLESLQNELPAHQHPVQDADAERFKTEVVKENLPKTQEFKQSGTPQSQRYPPGNLPDTAVGKPKASQHIDSYLPSSISSPAKSPQSFASTAAGKQAKDLGSFGLLGVVFLILVCIIAGVVLGRIIQAGLLTSPSTPARTTSSASNMVMPEEASTDMVSGTMAPVSVRIKSIEVDSSGRYIVAFETIGYTPKLPGIHMHFFFNTVPVDQAGKPGDGHWLLWSGPSPFTMYREMDRPDFATEMCVLVANHDHTIIPGSGNCENLP